MDLAIRQVITEFHFVICNHTDNRSQIRQSQAFENTNCQNVKYDYTAVPDASRMPALYSNKKRLPEYLHTSGSLFIVN